MGGDSVVDLHDISEKSVSDLAEYDYLIIGCPTWNIGDVQDDWDAVIDDLDDVDFGGKTIAYFGTGDQVGYADNFQDAMGILEEKISELGARRSATGRLRATTIVSRRLSGTANSVGLALDDDNESEKTESRSKLGARKSNQTWACRLTAL